MTTDNTVTALCQQKKLKKITSARGPFWVQHVRMHSEVASMEKVAKRALHEKHHGPRTMIGVYEPQRQGHNCVLADLACHIKVKTPLTVSHQVRTPLRARTHTHTHTHIHTRAHI